MDTQGTSETLPTPSHRIAFPLAVASIRLHILAFVLLGAAFSWHYYTYGGFEQFSGASVTLILSSIFDISIFFMSLISLKEIKKNPQRYTGRKMVLSNMTILGLSIILKVILIQFFGLNKTLLIKQIINALALGGIYALIAVGYTMVYGIIKLINFAHGEIYMVGAFVGIFVIGAGYSFWLGIVVSIAVCAVLGMTIDFIAYRPLRKSPRLAALITAIGISLAMQNLAMIMWESRQRAFPALEPTYTVSFAIKDNEQVQKYFDGFRDRLDKIKNGQLDDVDCLLRYEKAKKDLEVLRSAEAPQRDIAGAERKLKKITSEIPQVLSVTEENNNGSTLLRIVFQNGSDTGITFGLLKDISKKSLQQVGGLRARRALSKELSMQSQEQFFHTAALQVGEGDQAIKLTWNIVFILLTTIVLMILLELIVHKTRVGKAMRACSIDKTAAALVGINVNRIISITFMIGSGMAAVAGILYGLYLGSGIYYRMGYYAGVIAFAAAVLGGIGNIRGAMLGGALFGVIQVFAKAYVTDFLQISNNYDYAFAFGILITVILIKPTGILGKDTSERA